MKKSIKNYIVLLLMLIICYNSYGKINNLNLRTQKITSNINFENIYLSDALLILSEETQTTFIPDNNIKNIILDLSFPAGENMENLIEVICEIYNLSIKQIGNIYLLSEKTKNLSNNFLYGKISLKNYNSGIDGVKVTLANTNIPAVYSQNGGKYILPNIENGVYIVNFEKDGYISKGDIINIDKKIKKLDMSLVKNNNFKPKIVKRNNINILEDPKTNSITKKILLNNDNIEEIKNTLIHNIGQDLKVSILKKQNALIITGNKNLIENTERLIEEIDKPLKQVYISSDILDISNNLFEELGFDWNFTHKNNSEIQLLNDFELDNLKNTHNSSLKLVSQFNSKKDILSFGLKLLEATHDLVISANPRMIVGNGEVGNFKITTEVIVGDKRNENDKTDKTTITPIFKEAGIILKVIPHIIDDDNIILDTLLEVSNFNLNPENGTYNSSGGSKISREIKTKIKVKNGQTIFIGGLKKAVVQNANNKVPFFGTLPMIKYFFKNKSVKHSTSDIFIKLKVNIIDEKNFCFES